MIKSNKLNWLSSLRKRASPFRRFTEEASIDQNELAKLETVQSSPEQVENLQVADNAEILSEYQQEPNSITNFIEISKFGKNATDTDPCVSNLIESKKPTTTTDEMKTPESTDESPENLQSIDKSIFNQETILNLSPWTRKKMYSNEKTHSLSEDLEELVNDKLNMQTVYFSNEKDMSDPYKIKITFI